MKGMPYTRRSHIINTILAGVFVCALLFLAVSTLSLLLSGMIYASATYFFMQFLVVIPLLFGVVYAVYLYKGWKAYVVDGWYCQASLTFNAVSVSLLIIEILAFNFFPSLVAPWTILTPALAGFTGFVLFVMGYYKAKAVMRREART